MPGQCIYCGTQMKRGRGKNSSPRGASIDHLIPSAELRRKPHVVLTDRQRFYNKVPCCIGCNGRKGDMDPREWLTHIDPTRRATIENILKQLPVTLIYGA